MVVISNKHEVKFHPWGVGGRFRAMIPAGIATETATDIHRVKLLLKFCFRKWIMSAVLGTNSVKIYLWWCKFWTAPYSVLSKNSMTKS